jgi:uncharacterized protein
MITVNILLKEDLAEVLKDLDRPIEESARQLIVLELYREHKISIGKAAELLEMDLLDFIRYSSSVGIPYLDLPSAQLDRDFTKADDILNVSRKHWLTVIADATVLIGLHQIGHLFLLRELFEHIVIPPAVAEETKRSVPRQDWLEIKAPKQIPSSFPKHIGWGEREAIALALETHPDAFIVDDYAARVLAERLGIAIIGTAGILRLAKETKLIPNVRELLDLLRASGFRLSDVVYEAVLHASGEA